MTGALLEGARAATSHLGRDRALRRRIWVGTARCAVRIRVAGARRTSQRDVPTPNSQLIVDLLKGRDSTAYVRVLVCAIALASLAGSGCAHHRGGAASFAELAPGGRPQAARPNENVTISSETRLVGKIAKLNLEGGFVVMSFPIGHLPTLNQRLSVYRLGLKVGEIKVTGPQLDDNVVGDIAAGEARAGDEVRTQ